MNRGQQAPPAYLPLTVDGVPDELKQLNQFVGWLPEWQGVRWTKILVCTRTDDLSARWSASSTDAATWSTFQEAVGVYSACGDEGPLRGVGFVFAPDGGLVGVDLDNCRDPETGVIAPWAQKIIDKMASYTEVSPSGTGVHIYIKGRLPGTGRKKGPVEVYDRGRYFTVTGQRVEGTPATIEDRQEELDRFMAFFFPGDVGSDESADDDDGPDEVGNELSDDQVIERASTARNGAKFRALFVDGDKSAYVGKDGEADDSAADQALVNLLAFWVNYDEDRVDALFRRSALYRSKWERRDYRERTFRKARAGKRRGFGAPQADASQQAEQPGEQDQDGTETKAVPGVRRALLTRRLSDIQEKPVDWIWPRRWARGFLTGIFGDGGTGKSTLDTMVMARRTTGRPMPFETVVSARPPGNCVVLSLEDDPSLTLKPRFMLAGGDPDRLFVIESVYDPSTKKRVGQVELERDLEMLKAKLLEVEAVHFTVSPISAYLGSARNSWKDSDVRAIADPLLAMAAELRISGTLVSHPNKNSAQKAAYRMSGSQALYNALRLVLVTAFDPEDPDQKRLVVVGGKRSICELPPPLAFRAVVQKYSVNGQDLENVVLEFEPEPLDPKKYSADFLLGGALDSEKLSELAFAMRFLEVTLDSTGKKVPSADVDEAAAAYGIKKGGTYARARRAMNVQSAKEAKGWMMWIDPKDHPVNKARRRQL